MIIFWETFKKGSGLILEGNFVTSPATLIGQATQGKLITPMQQNNLNGQTLKAVIKEDYNQSKVVSGQSYKANLTES